MPGLQPRGRLAEQPAQGTTVAGWGASIPWYGEPQSHGMGSRMGSLNPMVWGASIPWYGEPQSHGMGSLNPMVWGASIPWYGEPQSQGMGSLNPKVWNELHHHVTRSFDEWKLTDKDIPAFVSLSLRVQQRALRRHLGGAVDDASGGDRG